LLALFQEKNNGRTTTGAKEETVTFVDLNGLLTRLARRFSCPILNQIFRQVQNESKCLFHNCLQISCPNQSKQPGGSNRTAASDSAPTDEPRGAMSADKSRPTTPLGSCYPLGGTDFFLNSSLQPRIRAAGLEHLAAVLEPDFAAIETA